MRYYGYRSALVVLCIVAIISIGIYLGAYRTTRLPYDVVVPVLTLVLSMVGILTPSTWPEQWSSVPHGMTTVLFAMSLLVVSYYVGAYGTNVPFDIWVPLIVGGVTGIAMLFDVLG